MLERLELYTKLNRFFFVYAQLLLQLYLIFEETIKVVLNNNAKLPVQTTVKLFSIKKDKGLRVFTAKNFRVKCANCTFYLMILRHMFQKITLLENIFKISVNLKKTFK